MFSSTGTLIRSVAMFAFEGRVRERMATEGGDAVVLRLRDQPLIHQLVEVTIDGPEADIGHLSPGLAVDLVGAERTVAFVHDVDDDLDLLGPTCTLLKQIISNNYHYYYFNVSWMDAG